MNQRIEDRGDDSMERELAEFAAAESKKLGLHREQWTDTVHTHFTAAQRTHTTLLVSGLTLAHDHLVAAALRGIGYKVEVLDCPDNAALQFGREFGNRGQCNPTYFTVGNLVKHLIDLRDNQGIPTEDDPRRTTCSSPRARAGRAGSGSTSPSTARPCATRASTASA